MARPPSAEPRRLRSADGSPGLEAEQAGEGLATICAHGLTATRRQVLHGSKALPRGGFEVTAYDARGHGESEPPEVGEDYAYRYLAADLGRILDRVAPAPRRALLIGHSMGAHTAIALTLVRPERVAGLVLIGPVYTGDAAADEALERWNALADALEMGGPEAFADSVAERSEPAHAALTRRLALERARLHRRPAAVADALRQVPAERPFGSLTELRDISIPTLVIASHDEIDPGHPYSAAAAYAETIDAAQLISEREGESPLAWQGGRLSRAIGVFAQDAGLLGG